MIFKDAFERIQSVTGVRTQNQVADILSIRQSSVSDAKRRGHVPAKWLVTLVEKYGVNPAWIRSGQEPKYMADHLPIPEPTDNPADHSAE